MNTTTRNVLKLQSNEFSVRSVAPNSKLARKLERLRACLSVQTLREYDHRKDHFGATSVVPIKEGICLGCCVSLSQRTLRLAYGRLTECEHCGRLVYNSARREKVHLEVCAA